MTESNEQEKGKLFDIDQARFKRLDDSDYISLIEDFEYLRIKIGSGKPYTQEEYVRFQTLTKYLKDNAHSKAIRLMCETLCEKFEAMKRMADEMKNQYFRDF